MVLICANIIIRKCDCKNVHKVNNLHNTDMTDVIPAFVIFKNYLNIKNFYNLTNYIEKLVKKFFSPIFYGTFFTAPLLLIINLKLNLVY